VKLRDTGEDMSLFPRSDIELRIADLLLLIGQTGVGVSDEIKLLLRASCVIRFANRFRKNQESRPIIISALYFDEGMTA